MKYYYSFNGSDNYVGFPTPTYLPSGNSSRSISCWYVPHIIAGERPILGWGTITGNQAFALSSLSSAPNKMSVWGYSHDINGSITLVSDTLYHVCLTYDSTSNTLKTYINNSIDINTTTTNYNTVVSGGVFNFFYVPVLSGYNQGKLSDVKIYNTVLSDSDITNLYNGIDVTSGKVFEALCNEGSGVCRDTVGGNNGTVYGTKTTFYNPYLEPIILPTKITKQAYIPTKITRSLYAPTHLLR